MNDTITALTTPRGQSGVAVIRISGPLTTQIAETICGSIPNPRQGALRQFKDSNNEAIDEGLVLLFPGPNSFTGEDVVELQGHGSPVVIDMLLTRIIELGARMARPGEFSERAFLNNKLDLAQAEAIADLIHAATEKAARSAMHSLQGDFSKLILELSEQMIHLRMYVEAAIDFPEEEVDFLSDGVVQTKLNAIKDQLDSILAKAKAGTVLRDGLRVALVGKPNVGKSSLLNRLVGDERAIVTDIAGTTRDTLVETIQLDGVPVVLIDTAGLRDTEDKVESIGVERARNEIEKADLVLLLLSAEQEQSLADIKQTYPELVNVLDKLMIVNNKIDLTQQPATTKSKDSIINLYISAKQDLGIDLLCHEIKKVAGFSLDTESHFIARRRHLTALKSSLAAIRRGKDQLENNHSGELLAEELRCAQQDIGVIVGEFTSEDLLGRIFSEFCIGK